MESPLKRRAIGMAECPDMIHWTEPATIIVPDKSDFSDIDTYSLQAMIYENWHVGFLWRFETTNVRLQPQFVFSRDGVNYNRDYKDPIIALGDNGDFDSAVLYARPPIVRDDAIYCFYYAANWRSREQLLAMGDKAMAGIGLAMLPLDGFVSLDGPRLDTAVVTTRAFTFSGKGLYLNVQPGSDHVQIARVRVELLDGRHVPIEGYTLDDADVVTFTSPDQVPAQRISWAGKNDLSALDGTPVRLKIRFNAAKLYSFQFK